PTSDISASATVTTPTTRVARGRLISARASTVDTHRVVATAERFAIPCRVPRDKVESGVVGGRVVVVEGEPPGELEPRDHQAAGGDVPRDAGQHLALGARSDEEHDVA